MGNANSLLMTALSLAAAGVFGGDLAVDGNLNVTSNLTGRSISVTNAAVNSLSVNGPAAMNGNLTVLGQRVQVGANANASNDNAFVWSDGTAVGSTASNQFTAFASNGFRLLGGPIQGNGSGLTNLNLSGAVPTNSITSDKLVGNAVTTAKLADVSVTAAKLADGSVTSAKILDGAVTDADIAAAAAIAQSKVSGLTAAVGSLNTHLAAVNNPHGVTAAQTGAYTSNQTATAISNAIAGSDLGKCVRTNHTGAVAISGVLTASTFAGNGFSITNLNLAAYVGNNLTWDAVSNKLSAAAGNIDSNAVAAIRTSLQLGSAATNNASAFAPANLSQYASGTVTYSNGHFYAATQLAPADVTNAVLSAWPQLDTDKSDDLTTAGATMTGDFDMNGKRVRNLPAPLEAGDAVSKDYLLQILSSLPPQGNLSMGAYTNGTHF